jgi:hypothetical protein
MDDILKENIFSEQVSVSSFFDRKFHFTYNVNIEKYEQLNYLYKNNISPIFIAIFKSSMHHYQWKKEVEPDKLPF